MIAVLGAGAFGSALAIALSSAERDVLLWGRDVSGLDGGAPKLPGVASPDRLRVTDDLAEVAPAGIVLLALPTQAMAAFLRKNSDVLQGKTLIACCKGIDLASGSGPTAVIQTNVPKAHAAVLSGPSFAADIARGLPTALTLAADWDLCDVQEQLSTPVLRLYRSSDPIGVEVGGALKNVVAIACGGAIGAGLGESARAALMTRGLSEIQRLGAGFGARPETLTGLSGLGDLALTCTSEHSRNYRHGLALGRGQGVDETATVEGVATADAVCAIADARGFDMPICREVAALCAGNRAVTDAMEALLARPLKEE